MSECASREEFLEAFRGYCDGESIFVSTASPRRVGATVSFRVTLANGDPLIVGSGDIVEAYPDERNDLGRPGMRIKFKKIDGLSRETVGEFDAGAEPNGSGARIDCRIEEETGTAKALSPVPPSTPRHETMRVTPRTWQPPPVKEADTSALGERITLPIKKAPFEYDDEDTNITEAPAPRNTAASDDVGSESGPLTSAPVIPGANVPPERPPSVPAVIPPRPSSSPAPESEIEPAPTVPQDEPHLAPAVPPTPKRDPSEPGFAPISPESDPAGDDDEAAPAAAALPALPDDGDDDEAAPGAAALPALPDDDDAAPEPGSERAPVREVPTEDDIEAGWGDIDDWKRAELEPPPPRFASTGGIADVSIPEVEVSGEFEIPVVLRPRTGSHSEADDSGAIPIPVARSASGSISQPDDDPASSSGAMPTASSSASLPAASSAQMPAPGDPRLDEIDDSAYTTPRASNPTPVPAKIPTPPPGSVPPAGGNRPMTQPVVPGRPDSVPGAMAIPAAPLSSTSPEPEYPRLHSPSLDPTTNTEISAARGISPVVAAAISGLVAAAAGLGLGYVIWGGEESVATSARNATAETSTDPGESTAGAVESKDSVTGTGGDQPAGTDDTAGNDTAAAVAPAAAKCSLSVTSKPKSATVLVGDNELGKTPFEGSAPCGELEIVVRKPHYQDATQTAVLASDSPGSLDFDLSRKTYRIRVTSDPPGAKVKFNGKTIGKAPASRKVKAFQKVKISVSKSGFKSSTKVVRAKRNQTVKVTLEKSSRRKSKSKSKSKSKRKKR